MGDIGKTGSNRTYGAAKLCRQGKEAGESQLDVSEVFWRRGEVRGWLDPEGESGSQGQETPSSTRRSFEDTLNSKLDQIACFKNLKRPHHFSNKVEAPGRPHHALYGSSYLSPDHSVTRGCFSLLNFFLKPG